ncbi:MAG: hypothetical protein QM784_15465 [Polyangiaceae bacterium]
MVVGVTFGAALFGSAEGTLETPPPVATPESGAFLVLATPASFAAAGFGDIPEGAPCAGDAVGRTAPKSALLSAKSAFGGAEGGTALPVVSGEVPRVHSKTRSFRQ